MCYSFASSLQTTLISFIVIVYLFSSNIPHFKWIAVTLIGWCGMQFAELLLWLTEPNKHCTKWNTIITFTLIPLILMSQVIGPLLGSLYVIPWDKSSSFRKNFIIYYSIIIIIVVGIKQFYKPYKLCTTVTPQGHLHWLTYNYKTTLTPELFDAYLWLGLILLPFILFWKKSVIPIVLLLLIPLFAFIYGMYFTDSKGSIWCFYTSYTSIIASIMLFLHQFFSIRVF
jgi:hypothetical protein